MAETSGGKGRTGEEVRSWLKSIGRRQGWLAQQLGASQACVSNWLNDNPGCSANKRAQLTSMTRALMDDPTAWRGDNEPRPVPAMPVPLAQRQVPPPAPIPAQLKRPRAPAPPPPAAPPPLPWHDDGEVVFVGSSVSADSILRTAPHPRDQCVIYPICAKPCLRCALCYCVVCDEPAADCAQWPSHCEAIMSGPANDRAVEKRYWRDVRRKAQEAKGLKPASVSIYGWLSAAAQQPSAAAAAPSPVHASGLAAPPADEVGASVDVKPLKGEWLQITLRILADTEPDAAEGLA
jgi:hypothetical protein